MNLQAALSRPLTSNDVEHAHPVEDADVMEERKRQRDLRFEGEASLMDLLPRPFHTCTPGIEKLAWRCQQETVEHTRNAVYVTSQVFMMRCHTLQKQTPNASLERCPPQ